MNTATIRGNWNITKGKLKQKYAQLTDDDLVYVEGQEQELLGRIQKRINRPREELESFLRDECACDFGPGESSAREQANRAFRPSHGMPPSTNNPGPRRAPSSASFKK